MRRYPVVIEVADGVNVEVAYTPEAFITAAEAEEIIKSLLAQVGGNIIIKQITIPATGWKLVEGDSSFFECQMYCDVAIAEATANMFPVIGFNTNSIQQAKNAGVCTSAQAAAGSIRVWSISKPQTDISATVALLANKDLAGAFGVVAAPGVSVAELNEVRNLAQNAMDTAQNSAGGFIAYTGNLPTNQRKRNFLYAKIVADYR